MKKYFGLFILFFSLAATGQNSYYTAPVKIPLTLSASFAELRSNHFHSGIDIKTQGVTGLPVFAVADGFVSRISVSPSGYGNALYIDHYNGTTSVYGHLQEFREDIQKYVKKMQYLKKSFAVNIQVSPELFLVEKGEMVAKSGNSGSSGGPHLHFEIRDTQSEEAMNPLNFGFDVTDKTAPKITSLQISSLADDAHVNYQQGKKTYPVTFYNGKYHIQNNPVIPLYGEIGFSIEANDYFDFSANRCGINTMILKVDGNIHFEIDLNRLSFDQTRYINSFTDYQEWTENRRWYQKTWIDPGNLLKNYILNVNNGIININDGNTHQIEIEIKDTYENTSVLTFSVKGDFRKINSTQKTINQWFDWNKENSFETEDFKIEIQEGTLYQNLGFVYSVRPGVKGYFSEIHSVDYNTVPLHKNASISIKSDLIPERLQEKALLVAIDSKTGKYWSAGGKYENGWVNGNIRILGDYAVRVDTIAPTILPLSISGKAKITETDRLRFIISDDLSGIKNYTGTIDGNWALFEYDAKNNLITHYFDSERFELKKRHEFKLVVTDNKNNISVYEASFWK
ncbi:MAG: M23 family metallopeptidase [Draconibacterium sp.]